MPRKLHTRKDAEYCLLFFQKFLTKHAKLIGSFGKGAEQSYNDIDILLKNFTPKGQYRWMAEQKLRNRMKIFLEASKVEKTDWGGWYFHNTIFGNVDVFFTDKDFDY